jgi:hypothetical protein
VGAEEYAIVCISGAHQSPKATPQYGRKGVLQMVLSGDPYALSSSANSPGDSGSDLSWDS